MATRQPERFFYFGQAILELKFGKKVARKAWRSNTNIATSAPFLIFVPGSITAIQADRPLGQALPGMVGKQMAYSPHIDIVEDRYSTVRVWTPQQVDLLALDWYVVMH